MGGNESTPLDESNSESDKQEGLLNFSNFLAVKWKGDTACPVCKESSWVLQERLGVLLSMEAPKEPVELGVSFPSYLVICTNCSYTMMFNALISGVSNDKP